MATDGAPQLVLSGPLQIAILARSVGLPEHEIARQACAVARKDRIYTWFGRDEAVATHERSATVDGLVASPGA